MQGAQQSGGFGRTARAMLVLVHGFVTAVTATTFASRLAHAETGGTEGTVVSVEKDDLVIDLGAGRGAAGGDIVELWRPLRLRHPVTGKTLTDRFLIGRLRLLQVRPSLSLAASEGALSRPAEVGDVVVMERASLPPPPPPSVIAKPATSEPTTASDTPPTPEQTEDAHLSALFDALRGTDLPTRIQAYEGFAAAHPHGRRGPFLLEEARELRALMTLREQREVPDATQAPPRVAARVQSFPRVVAGQPLRVALAVLGETSGVILHVRRKGAATYSSQPMTHVQGEYWAATVPGDQIEAPALLYFVEVADTHGTIPVVGTAENPEQAEVMVILPDAPSHVLGQAAFWTDYARFNTRQANDYIWQTEGLIGARFGDTGVRAVRMGFGVYRGQGGDVYDLDTLHRPPTPVGLTYGYLETELGFTKYLSIGVRGTVGLDNSGLAGGAFGFLRIGSDLGTNLWFGAEGLGGIGVRGITQFEWNAFPRWPIAFRTEVTDEPAGANIGVRAIAQVGYRFLPHLVVSVRGSYQGRTIEHSGPGGGAAVGYAW